MAEKTLNDLFLAHLKDIYYAEKKIYRTLPKMVKAAENPSSRRPSRLTAKRRRARSSASSKCSR